MKELQKVEKLMELVRKDAENKKHAAGMSGAYHDGGASVLEAQVKFYEYGMKGQIPPEWEKYEIELDPEWDEYVRLSKKFKNKRI